MKERIIELDFVKGILISLMVLFHLTLFTTAYGYLTQWVYSFHMSGFLLISGYLQNVNRTKMGGVKNAFRRILIPYMVFETLYIVGISLLGSILGSENHLGELSISSLGKILFINPIGTYWYLHTLFICIVVSHAVAMFRQSDFNTLLLFASVLYILTLFIDGLLWSNVMYFIIGAFIQRLNLKINQCIIPSVWAILPVLLISFGANNLSRGDVSGIGLTVCMISLLMGVFTYVPLSLRKLFTYLGKNSLAIVLFSPFFSVLTKQYISLFNFDTTHVIWAFVSLSMVIALCLLVAYICDKIKMSHFLMGSDMYKKYE